MIIISVFSSTVSLVAKIPRESVNDDGRPTSGKQKASRKRALVIPVAYFWPDFVESYSFLAEFVGAAAIVLLSCTR